MFRVEVVRHILTEHETPIAPSTYYAAKSQPPSARAVRDEQLHPCPEGELRGLWHGRGLARAQRKGTAVLRCPVERLMREFGIQGARSGRKMRTTAPR